ncbi:DNA mismatch repair protein MSH7 isoform X2 [Olea europaea var. sylvestris]|uniref:DNA mismatch repair protein MSH7 isoform X2 n=1 Tax=Olea europaea var. sylvestris TaxID=158386 RepID=UPI000C1D5584|nr:DNA mismatch repair protein MSH7 isoform X2 [Olea europaea var. sylvestris]
MQRQKSILSFLKRPAPDDKNSGGFEPEGRPAHSLQAEKPNQNAVVLNKARDVSDEEIRGTETPPEKLPRQIFSVNDGESTTPTRPSLFSSIKHKFMKPDTREKPSVDRFHVNDTSSGTFSLPIKHAVPEELGNACLFPEHLSKQNGHNANETMYSEGDKERPFLINIDDDVSGPVTPGTAPLVPRLKRVQEDMCNSKDRSDCLLPDARKRTKLIQLSNRANKVNEDVSETKSKFEWLHLSQIRDVNRRKPDNPLYDKKTLYIPPEDLKKMSASQKQYWDVKRQYMDVVLFFKVGKFYELYELDAEIGHKELDWKMTQSGVGKCRQVGISESGIDEAVQKLIARGYKVGRVEQLETSEQAKSRGAGSVIQRKLVHVLTPSTTESNIGPDAVHLLAIKEFDEGHLLENGSTVFGFAFVDCAALKFSVGSISDDASCAALGALLMQVSPKEIIYEARGLSKECQKALKKYTLAGSTLSQLSPAQPGHDFGEVLEVRNLIQSKGYFRGSCIRWDHVLDGVMHGDLALCALGGLINHLSRFKLDDALRNGDIIPYEVYRGCLRMDGQTLVNLEIFNNNADGGPSGTLYKYLDNCMTSPGKRLLRNWICHPLNDVEKINSRLAVVEELMSHSEIVLLLAQSLRKLPDLERLLGRAKSSMQSSALLSLPLIGSKVLKQRVKVFGLLVKGLRIGLELLMLLQNEGIMVSSLSKVVCLPILSGSDGLDKFLTQFEAAVDSEFPNYQDHDVTDSESETLVILMDLFLEKATQWSQVIQAINCIDVLRSFAVTTISSCGAMCKPMILPHSKSTNLCEETTGPILKMEGLWHPYTLGQNGGLPVSNDIQLGGYRNDYAPCTLLLTGPNMGGKSTLLRATCLAVIMAQLGCYVPCEICVFSLVDTIFTRLGASDQIMTGESTFLIECTETASVLQNATHNSLVLLDELGRGTSTFDGYAIAYAVLRHLIEKVNCRLLFATHYHLLTKEFGTHPRVALQHMATSLIPKSEMSSGVEQEIVFLYRLASGACLESYGMQVALMAGIPRLVVEAASKAGHVMKNKVRESFKSSEQRVKFSTLHEEWLKALLTISKSDDNNFDTDAFDTLFCMWHELKTSYKSLN